MKCVEWILEQTKRPSAVCGGTVLTVLAGCLLTAQVWAAPAGSPSASQATSAPRSSGAALFDEKCRTVAGEKIYRKVEDVEGILLLKVRPQATGRQLADPMWSGAAFALEAAEDGYIRTFLGYEYATVDGASRMPHDITPERRGYISSAKRPGGRPGYRFVDVMDASDGVRRRYSGRWDEPWQYDKSYLKGYVKFFLDSAVTSGPPPRYAVTYEDRVVPEERAVWVASSAIKVYDLKTKELLGEMIRYAWAGGGPTAASPAPWLRARKCPSHAVGADAATRKFVDQILIPKQGQ